MGLDEAGLAALEARMARYELDAPADTVPFSRKLRRETGWSAAYAARVIEEYKRFAILAVAAGGKVSPSKAVDRVWHLHLTDTRRYWDEFCPQVLGRPLHHEPSRGGTGEAEVLAAQYRATLEAYGRVFGEAPPRDIWPSGPTAIRRVRRALAGVPRSLRGRAALQVAVLAAPLLLVGCAVVDSASPGATQGPQFILGYAILCVASLALMGWLEGLVLAPRPGPTIRHEALGSYELAYLAGGSERVFAAALLRLIQAGNLVVASAPRPRRASRKASQQALSLGAALPKTATPIERAIVEAVRLGRLTGPAAVSAPIKDMEDRLRKAGLLPSLEARKKARWIAAAILAAVMGLGVTRLMFGFANHKAVGFLVLALIFTPFWGLAMSATLINGRTPYAKRLVKAAKAARPLLKSAEDPDPALAFALYGLAAVATADFAGYRHVVQGYGVGATGGDGGGTGCSGGGGCGG